MLLLLYIVIPILQIYLFLSGQFALGLTDTLNFISSILALHWLLANIIISSKVPVLQKHLPYDKRIRFHIVSSIGIVLSIGYHFAYKLILGFYFSPVTWALIFVLALFFIFALLWIPLPFVKKIKGFFSYDQNKIIHKFFVLLLSGLILLHITGAGLFANVPIISNILYWSLYSFSIASFIFSLSKNRRVKAEIIDITTSRDILTIVLKTEVKLKYKSGQFTFLESKNSLNKKEQHPFSFLSSPNEEYISLAIRKVGDFTANLGTLKVGDNVYLKGAFGSFYPGKEEDICLIASGIGTVPIISILKDIYHYDRNRVVKVFLAVNNSNELPEKDKTIDTILNMPNVELNLLQFEKDKLRFSKEFFSKRLTNHKKYKYYLCSSPNVRNIVVDALSKLGVQKGNIKFEAFAFS